MRSSGKVALDKLRNIEGYLGSCLVDLSDASILGVDGHNPEVQEIAGKGNASVVRAEREMMEMLGIDGALEDVLITLDGQYHIMRPLGAKSELFLNVVLNRESANLAMARLEIRAFEKAIHLDQVVPIKQGEFGWVAKTLPNAVGM